MALVRRDYFAEALDVFELLGQVLLPGDVVNDEVTRWRRYQQDTPHEHHGDQPPAPAGEGEAQSPQRRRRRRRRGGRRHHGQAADDNAAPSGGGAPVAASASSEED
jgi:hypothetical protein